MLAYLERTGDFLLGQAGYFVVFGAFFFVIESLWPAVPRQRKWRQGTSTDLVLSFLNPLPVLPVAAYLTMLLVTSLIGLAGSARWGALRSGLAMQPYWLQLAAAVIVAEIAAYWKHRVFHMRWLWPIHAVHHSATEVDWLTNERDHPLQLLGTHLAITTSLALLGFSAEMFVAQAILRRFYSLYTHANVNWSHGPLNHVFVSPAFHRWHHSTDPQMAGKNFAVMLSVLDVVFGSYRFPESQPVAFGLSDGRSIDSLGAALVHPLTYLPLVGMNGPVAAR
jgi:sterol desaturase/sphingolipid hydroxylase (fatty acid hydroxylase superfamily)